MPKKKGRKKKKKENPLIKNILTKYDKKEIEKNVLDYSDKNVMINFHLLNWDHMDFKLVLSEHTSLFIVEQKIKERHGGSIEKITLYKNSVQPSNLLTDLTKTLDEIFGFGDGNNNYIPPPSLEKDKKEDNIAFEITIFYDCTIYSSNCPLLLLQPLTNYDDKKKKKREKK